MPVTPFLQSHKTQVLELKEVTYASANLARFVWQPCLQVESLEQECLQFVFEDTGIKGYAAAYQLDDTHFRLNLVVHPEYHRKGIGSQLLNTIEQQLVGANTTYLQARALETMPESLKFLLARGFIEIHTMRGMSLRATDFSFDKWNHLGQQLTATGYVVTNLKREVQSNVGAIDKLARLYKAARQGWPSPDPSWTLATTSENLRAPFVSLKHPEHLSIIRDKDQYIGFTSARSVIGTAVHPDYRNRGIATYLKAFDINQCIEEGKKNFESSTANPVMQRVNEKLGYRFNGLAEVRFVRELLGHNHLHLKNFEV